MMSSAPSAAAAARYRHVIFPEPAAPALRPVDYTAGTAARASSAGAGRAVELPLSADERSFLGWLFGSAGLDVGRYKAESLKRRLPACLRAVRATDLADARRRIHDAPRARRAALSALVIGVTSFFRDPAVFSALGRRLPELAQGDGGGRLRVWSAGCSDGAELYSVAMLLAELRLLDRSDLLGTDCRADAVDRARAGSFDASLTAGVSPAVLARYFTPVLPDGRPPAGGVPAGGVSAPGAAHVGRPRHPDRDRRPWRVGRPLRDAAQWRTADVLTVREPGPWDVVLCRNLAIYLQPTAAAGLWRQLAAAVRPGGLLVLGKAERPGGDGRHFIPAGPCLYRRTGAADGAGDPMTGGGNEADGVADVA